MAKVQSLTSLGQSPETARRKRMQRYTIAMSIRVVCLIIGIFVQGPLMWICFAGAIFLPYIAVVDANAGNPVEDELPGAATPARAIEAEKAD